MNPPLHRDSKSLVVELVAGFASPSAESVAGCRKPRLRGRPPGSRKGETSSPPYADRATLCPPAGQWRPSGLRVYACAVAEPYTSTTWIVKPGQEDEFVRRWTEFAEWSAGQGLAAPAMLLRDVDEPTRFVSFGPWENLQMIWRWRGLTGFQERVALLNEVLVSFEPRTLELVGGHRRRGHLKRSR